MNRTGILFACTGSFAHVVDRYSSLNWVNVSLLSRNEVIDKFWDVVAIR